MSRIRVGLSRTFFKQDGTLKHLKIYPYTPGGVGTSIATALEGKVRLGRNPPVPDTRFVEGSARRSIRSRRAISASLK